MEYLQLTSNIWEESRAAHVKDSQRRRERGGRPCWDAIGGAVTANSTCVCENFLRRVRRSSSPSILNAANYEAAIWMIIWPLLIARLHLAPLLRRRLFSAFIPAAPSCSPASESAGKHGAADRRGKENKAHLDVIHVATVW